MSKNGPDGTSFVIDEVELDQGHTLLFSLALLPMCKIAEGGDSSIAIQLPEGGGTNRIHIPLIGINGGPEDAKKIVCEHIDRIWAERC